MERILNFLADLEMNNNRDWFHENKKRYQEAKNDFEELVRDLSLALREHDDSIPMLDPKELTFKLMRDTRFSRDKSPYNPTFRAHISSQGKMPIPVGYYIQMRPGDRSFLGGGLFTDMFRDATARVREYISLHGSEWQEIITAPSFVEHFTVMGSALKNVPRGFDAGHPQAEYLKNKSWFIEYPVQDQKLITPNFICFATELFAQMKPFNDFINQALDGFQMPVR